MTLYIGEKLITPTIITKGSGSSDKYKVGDRVNDDSNNPVGTVSSIFTDGNGVRYAVVCLDAQYRTQSSSNWIFQYNDINVNLPTYDAYSKWEAQETATENTQAYIDASSSSGYPSPACSYCRSLSFQIDGVTYYGQVPNFIEAMSFSYLATKINDKDESSGSLRFPVGCMTSTRRADDTGGIYHRNIDGNAGGAYYNTNNMVTIPVLEIPLDI